MGINNNTINWTSGNNLNKERKTGRGMKGKMPVSDIFPNATVTASKSATHTWGLKHQAVHVIFIYCPDKDNGLKEEISEARWFTPDEIIGMKDSLRSKEALLKSIENYKNNRFISLDYITKVK